MIFKFWFVDRILTCITTSYQRKSGINGKKDGRNLCYIVTYAYIHIYIYMLDTYWRNELIRRKHDNDKDTVINDTGRKTQEDFFNNILPVALLQVFERVVQGLHVRGSWRPNINCNFLTPLLWPSRCVFLVL